MSFSLRWLFAAVAIAAVFAAGFTFQDIYWAIAAVTLTLVILSSAVVALALGIAEKSFWMPFCVIGWLYIWIGFTDMTRLSAYLPSTRVTFEAWMSVNEDLFRERQEELNPFSYYYSLTGTQHYIDDYQEPYYILLDIAHSLSALIVATVAGIIASYCVRRSKSTEH